MPVEIVLGPTNPQNGEINHLDLQRIIGDFENFAEIDSNISRAFRKINYVTIPRIVLKALLDEEKDDEYDYVNIHFGITLPDQRSCADNFQTDISNQLSVIINKAKLDGNVLVEKKAVGDLIIAIGFKSNIKPVDAPCCGKPSGGGGGGMI